MFRSTWCPNRLLVLFFAIGTQTVALSVPAALLIVDRFDDAPEATACLPEVSPDCSLRGAIIHANQDSDSDVIRLSAGTYTLSTVGILEDAAATGDLDITEAVEIQGEAGVVIDANGLDRVFHFLGNHNSRLSDLTISGGVTYAGFTDVGGAGLLNDGAYISLTRCTVTENSTHELGGGIYNRGGWIDIQDSRITKNDSETHGGGIFNQAGSTITLVDSTLDLNVSHGGGGGGLYNNGTATLSRTSIYSNQTHQGASHSHGGGIYNVEIINVFNCSILTNLAYNDSGGGIFNADRATLQHVSIDGNYATSGRALAVGASASTTISNTLIVGDCSSEGGSTSSLGNNIESPGNTCGFNIIGDIPFVQDARTIIESYDGGTGRVLALLPGSIAIDNAKPERCTMDYDQRNFSRPIDGTGEGESVCDIGAYEFLAEGPIFSDGFETGSSSLWSHTTTGS